MDRESRGVNEKKRMELQRSLPLLGVAYGIPVAAFFGIVLEVGRPILVAGIGALGGLLLGLLLRWYLGRR